MGSEPMVPYSTFEKQEAELRLLRVICENNRTLIEQGGIALEKSLEESSSLRTALADANARVEAWRAEAMAWRVRDKMLVDEPEAPIAEHDSLLADLVAAIVNSDRIESETVKGATRD